MDFRTEDTTTSTTMKDLAEILMALFASTPDRMYSSEALFAMAQRFHELLDAGVPETELIDHCRDQLTTFSQLLVRGTRAKGLFAEPRVVEAKLVRSLFLRCPKPPTWELEAISKIKTARELQRLAEQYNKKELKA